MEKLISQSWVRRLGWILGLGCGGFSWVGWGQTVEFSNCGGGDPGSREPIFAADCTTPLEGDGYRVQLFLHDAAAPGGFGPQVGPTLGSVGAGGCFSFGRIAVPGAIPGTSPTFVVRAWQVSSAGGESFETAAVRGVSATFQLAVAAGDVGVPPSPNPGPGGFTSFCLQDPCLATLGSPGSPFAPCGGGGEFTLNLAGTSCAWEVSLDPAVRWVTLDGPLSGTGTATVKFTVAPNRTGSARSARIETPAGPFEITQAKPVKPTFEVGSVGFRSDGFFHLKIVGDPCTKACVEASEDLVHWECINEFEMPSWGFHAPFLTDPQNYAKAYFRVVVREASE